MWVSRHNAHHANPNNIDLDPDIDNPVIAFTREEACRKQGIARFIVKYQAYLFIPITCLLGFSQHISGIQFLLQRQGKHTAAEALCMAIHFVVYWLAGLLPLWQAVLFVLIHQALHGLYLASVFAPNHKGMPVLDKDSRLSFPYAGPHRPKRQSPPLYRLLVRWSELPNRASPVPEDPTQQIGRGADDRQSVLPRAVHHLL